MFASKFIILSVHIISIGFCLGLNLECKTKPAPVGNPIPPYDEVKLVQRWSRSKCCIVDPTDKTGPNCDRCNKREIISAWTVHGLWASDSTGRYNLSYCTDPVKMILFDKYPAVLLNDMKKNWPDVRNSQDRDKDFWWYQWHKHGTCLRDIAGMDAHRSYFNKTLQLFHSYYLEEILMEGLIFQDFKYPLQDILKAFESTLKIVPTITCNMRNGLSYLHGIIICFNKQFELKDCPVAKSNCKSPVYFP